MYDCFADQVGFNDKNGNGKPISTGSIYFTETVAGIFDIVTAPQMRGKRIGTSMTVTAMQAAIEKGSKFCILAATEGAKLLYEKLGFISLKPMCIYQ